MNYDTPITILKLPKTTGIPLGTKLQPLFPAWCRELEVYHSRYWEGVQAGSEIVYLVELPLHRQVDATMFVQFRGHIYAIAQAQFGKDANLLPVTTLSLKRPEVAYDIAAV